MYICGELSMQMPFSGGFPHFLAVGLELKMPYKRYSRVVFESTYTANLDGFFESTSRTTTQ